MVKKIGVWWVVLALALANVAAWSVACANIEIDRENCLDLCEADDEVDPDDCPRLCGAK